MDRLRENIHYPTVQSFGEEWNHFTQEHLSEKEHREVFEQYFRIFPWDALPQNAVGFDIGCGTGRWAKLVAPRVGRLHCIDPSPEALSVARRNLARVDNCEFHEASLDSIPLEDSSMDFGYCLGVLHYVPDAQRGITSCVKKLKPGAPFLVYVYYAFENRPFWFRAMWRASDIVRRAISRLPFFLKYVTTWIIAASVYYPLARVSLLLEAVGFSVEHMPLSAYRRRTFYTMRTDSFDRFATPIEIRFTARELRSMMERAGFRDITLNDSTPYWCAVGYKANATNPI